MNIELVCLMLKGISKIIEGEKFGIESVSCRKDNKVRRTTLMVDKISVT
jgi:hypothetical protein